jgi:hypothetical protein
MKLPIALCAKTTEATISIFKCSTVSIRLPRDAVSWCPDNHTPRFVKNGAYIEFIFDAPNSSSEWTSTVSSLKQEEQQESLQQLL